MFTRMLKAYRGALCDRKGKDESETKMYGLER